MENKSSHDQMIILVKKATTLALELIDKINEKTFDNDFYFIFSDITASYILAYSYLATYLQGKKPYESYWNEIKKAAHSSLDIAFKSFENNIAIYEEELKNHVNH